LQVHDFSPWTLPNGLFWIVKVPDDEVQITEDTITVDLENVPTVDAFSFPPPPVARPENGISPYKLIPARVSFHVVYKRKKPEKWRRIHRGSRDPLSPLNWAGKMWDATNTGNFSVMYNDKTFSAHGNFESGLNFGEMGTERNGVFLDQEEDNDDNGDNNGQGETNATANSQLNQAIANAIREHQKTVLLKGRVPVYINQ
jgi:hypothetical protein